MNNRLNFGKSGSSRNNRRSRGNIHDDEDAKGWRSNDSIEGLDGNHSSALDAKIPFDDYLPNLTEEDFERDERENEDDEDGPEEEEYFERAAEKGMSLTCDASDDRVDQYMAHVFMQGMKMPNGEYREYFYEPRVIKRVQIPKARPLKQLVASTVPRMPHAIPDTLAHSIGEVAWEVKSTFFFVT